MLLVIPEVACLTPDRLRPRLVLVFPLLGLRDSDYEGSRPPHLEVLQQPSHPFGFLEPGEVAVHHDDQHVVPSGRAFAELREELRIACVAHAADQRHGPVVA